MKHLFLLLTVFLASFVTNAGITHHVQFSQNGSVLKKSAYSNQKTIAEFEGMRLNLKPKAAAIPMGTVSFSVPYNATDFKLSCKFNNGRDLKLDVPYLVNPEDPKDFLPSTESNFIEEQLGKIADVSIVEGFNKVVTIIYSPILVHEGLTSLTVYDSMDIDLDWSTSDNNATEQILVSNSEKVREGAIDYVKSLVANAESVESNAPAFNDKRNELSLNPDPDLYTPITTDYVIVCPQRLEKPLRRLAALRRLKGYSTSIVTIEYILSTSMYAGGDELSGINDDAGKLRAFLTFAYKNGTTDVLLAGRFDEIPYRYALWRNTNPEPCKMAPTDLYFSELNSNWDSNGNGIYGEREDSISYSGELNIGRIPFANEDEVNNFIDKLLIYELNPGNGDPSYLSKAIMTRQNESWIRFHYPNSSIQPFLDIYNGENLIDMTSDPNGPKGADVIRMMNNTPVGCHQFFGHGNPGSVSVLNADDATYGIVALDNNEAFLLPEACNGLDCINNKIYGSWCFNTSCTTMPYDTFTECTKNPDKTWKFLTYDDIERTFGEMYILTPNGSGVSYIGNTRPSDPLDGRNITQDFFGDLNKGYANSASSFIRGVTAGELFRKVRSTIYASHEDKLIKNLLGDPLTNLWISAPDKITFTEIENPGILLTPIRDPQVDYQTHIFKISTNASLISTTKLKNAIVSNYTFLLNHGNEREVSVIDNEIVTVFGKNALPNILPARIHDVILPFRFNLIAGDLEMGTSRLDGKITVKDGAEIFIESQGNVALGSKLALVTNSSFKIVAKGDITATSITIPKGCKVHLEGNSVTLTGITVINPADLTIVERNPKAKAKSMTRTPSMDDYTPFVVEGKTWWYEAINPARGYSFEFGLKIGEEVEINGVKWHKVYRMFESFNDLTDNSLTLYTEGKENNDSTYGYVREIDGKVYGLVYPDDISYFQFGQNAQNIWYHHEYLIYDFNEESYNIGQSPVADSDKHYERFEGISYPLTYIGSDDIENSGICYKRNKYAAEGDCACLLGTYELRVAQGIGVVGDDYTESFGQGAFMAPATSYYAVHGGELRPCLRYVTDPDHNIIYEHIGGLKLWEQFEGVESVAADTDLSQAEHWYNLQGIEVAKPTPPGVYILKKGATTRKVNLR